MVISDMLYILQHFNLNFIPFLLSYWENFKIAWKETIDKLK